MKFNKQSNVYTIVYIILMVVVVGIGLSWTAMALRGKQLANENADKMKQILASIHVVPEKGEDVAQVFNHYIVEQKVVNALGETISGHEAFKIDIAEQSKLPVDKRLLPVYVAKTGEGAFKYIIPMSGAGLWGPIWGYIAVDSDGSTIYGAFFAHQGETPGLGAEIEKPAFSNQFDGKRLLSGSNFLPIAVVKAGQKPLNGEDYVDGISGGTITSKGVGAMIDNCITPYEAFLTSIGNRN